MPAYDKVSPNPLTGYAPSGALGLDTTTPQLYVSGSAQMWEPVGGGGGANFPTNTNITSMQGIPSTVIDSAGYVFGARPFGTGSGVFIANQAWVGAGYTGPAVAVSDNSGHFALVGSTGFFTSGGVQGTLIKSLGDLQVQTPGILHVDSMGSYAPGTPLTITPNGISGAGSVALNIAGIGTLGQALLAFPSYPTQTTVGAAGGAAAQPATPAVYLPIKALVGGVLTEVVIPCHLAS